MKETLDRIQNWYKFNCNGDWEDNFGLSIATLDNPGWTIRIDLQETSLDKLDFARSYQDPDCEHNWFHIKTKNRVLEIACGPENLKEVLLLFLDEIIPNYSDDSFYYDIYLPLTGLKFNIWTPAKAFLLDEETVKLKEILPIDYKEIKVRELNQLDFNQADLKNLQLNYKEGDVLKVTIEDTFDGVILTTKM